MSIKHPAVGMLALAAGSLLVAAGKALRSKVSPGEVVEVQDAHSMRLKAVESAIKYARLELKDGSREQILERAKDIFLSRMWEEKYVPEWLDEALSGLESLPGLVDNPNPE